MYNFGNDLRLQTAKTRDRISCPARMDKDFQKKFEPFQEEDDVPARGSDKEFWEDPNFTKAQKKTNQQGNYSADWFPLLTPCKV